MVVVKRKETGDKVPNTAQLEFRLKYFSSKKLKKVQQFLS